MSATGFVDACGFIPVSSGTGDFVVSSAVVGYQTPASAGAVNAIVYSYRAESSDKSQWEIGFGAYTVSSTTLARTTIGASSTGSKVSFSAAPNVFITALSADLQNAALLTSNTLPVSRINGGTSNQFVQGDGTFQTQGRKLLNTLTGSNSVSLTDTSSFTSTFYGYELVFENLVPVTNLVTGELQVHSGGSFQTTSYQAQELHADGTNVVSASSTGFIGIGASGAISTAVATFGLNGSIRVSNPTQTSAPKAWWGQFIHMFTGPVPVLSHTVGMWNSTAAIDGFAFFFSTGNVSSGTIKVYGLT